ncbi:ABC transporter permease [Gulosibacter bifidus]|uniref:ABC transporter permease n=1 Tax=Gulosibacter bifidus TaxID=272239 RepID=A0ABW5RK96_9MICO|nr:ABC transporter permease [Gulosibacter bifidus]
MFVAWRELRHARGRFLLIGAVVALITLLVGFLSGLTGGLAAQNISAVLQIPSDRIVLQQPSEGSPSYATSEISASVERSWQDAAGVENVTAIGIVQSRAAAGAASEAPAKPSSNAPEVASAKVDSAPAPASEATGVALFGMPADALDNDLGAIVPTADDEVGLSKGAADDLGVTTGDTINITGTNFTVATVGEDLWYSHTPVIALTESAWQEASIRVGGSGNPTLLAVSGDADYDAIAADTDTSAQAPLASLTALEAFKSEIGSLGLMIALLFGISALVVGAFFTVWTMQRAGDIAVLKALGASTSSLIKDALGQALIVLIAGIGVGLAAVVGFGALAGQALPFELSPLTTLLPAGIMAVLGLGGAAVALRSVTKADPLTALGSNR